MKAQSISAPTFSPQPRPLKKDRPNQRRKRRIKTLDRKLSLQTRLNRCECGAEASDTAHIIPRRFQQFRHLTENVKPKCRACHMEEKYSKKDQRIRILNNNPQYESPRTSTI